MCVFDPNHRYARPGHLEKYDFEGPYVDPFNIYGLDSDKVPKIINPDEYNTERDVPTGSWDAFAVNEVDRKNLQNESFPSIRGNQTYFMSILSLRLRYIGVWISKVAANPATLWWAAKQMGLHPEIKERIKLHLERSEKIISPVIRQAWLYLFESWDAVDVDLKRDWYSLKSIIDKEGWNNIVARKYTVSRRPYLKVTQNYWPEPKPPKIKKKDLCVSDMFALNVYYPCPPDDIDIPDEWLPFVVSELRKNLEYAQLLEIENGSYDLIRISPIVPDENPDVDQTDRMIELSGKVISFVYLFGRLIKLNVSIARHEFETWPVNDDAIFCRLRIWACGNEELTSTQTFVQVITSLSSEAFWDCYHQRDLMFVLAKRLNNLPRIERKKIEVKLLKGPKKHKHDDKNEFEVIKAHNILNRITWLADKGCIFTFDLEKEINRLRKLATNWKPENAIRAVESMEVRGGAVIPDTDCSLLLIEPPGSVLSKAIELRKKNDNFLIKKDPFGGLSCKYPVRAFETLTLAAQNDEYPEWAWRTFLNCNTRKNDKPEFSEIIAKTISCYPDNAVANFINPASDWFEKSSKQLATHFPCAFETVITKFISVLRSQPQESRPAIARGNKKSDWAFEAINAPIGKIAKALFSDLLINDLKENTRFPIKWIAKVEELLSLDGDLHRYAIVIFCHNINWFYNVDPNWTETHLLSALNGNNEDDTDAFWYGFFWSASIPIPALYMQLKPYLLAFTKERRTTKRGQFKNLAAILLDGWGSINVRSKERFISNNEMREALLHANDNFRKDILWLFERGSKTKEKGKDNKWHKELPEFLKNVWPRQKSANTSTVSEQLCNLAFSDEKRFPDMVKIILPFITTIDRDIMLPNLRTNKDTIVDIYPLETLELLHKVLPDNVSTWPYDIEEILQRIGDADKKLQLDGRLLELKRKWNAR